MAVYWWLGISVYCTTSWAVGYYLVWTCEEVKLSDVVGQLSLVRKVLFFIATLLILPVVVPICLVFGYKDAIREQLGLPLVGKVAAGEPILAEAHIESRYQIDPGIFDVEPHFLLRVEGMSMRDAGILDGDLVAVHRSSDVRNRQIIVARLEDEVTVKRYRQEGHQVWLLPENPDFNPIEVDLREEPLTIEGVVVGVVRDAI